MHSTGCASTGHHSTVDGLRYSEGRCSGAAGIGKWTRLGPYDKGDVVSPLALSDGGTTQWRKLHLSRVLQVPRERHRTRKRPGPDEVDVALGCQCFQVLLDALVCVRQLLDRDAIPAIRWRREIFGQGTEATEALTWINHITLGARCQLERRLPASKAPARVLLARLRSLPLLLDHTQQLLLVEDIVLRPAQAMNVASLAHRSPHTLQGPSQPC